MRPIYFLLLIIGNLACQSTPESRKVEDFNFNWKFHWGDVGEAYQMTFNDTNWEQLRLPHDWSIQFPFTQKNAAGATGFLPGGIGWYRKNFRVPKTDQGKHVFICFDGVYNNAEVWINGHYLGKRPYGYVNFEYELTPHLKWGEENIIAVKADRSAFIDSRWYPGSGIYRNVKLVTTHDLHIPIHGTFVETLSIEEERAEINIALELVNLSAEKENIKLINEVWFDGKKITQKEEKLKLKEQFTRSHALKMDIEQAVLWDISQPKMYQLITKIEIQGQEVDQYTTPFGIRTFEFTKNQGFFLNGQDRMIKGVCLHHDGGLVGAAVPKGVWKRRLKKLKNAGVNAIRTAHNPPSAEFLDLCDQMGFIVQHEFFDEWDNPKDKRHNYNQQQSDSLTIGYTRYFREWGERDLKAVMKRDRNHPSIVMWSIGNEIEWTYPSYGNATGYWGKHKTGNINYYWDEPRLNKEEMQDIFAQSKKDNPALTTTAQRLSRWTKEMDKNRPVTANLVMPTVSNFSGYSEALDVVGLSYRQAVYGYMSRNYPEMTFLGTENWTRYHEWKAIEEHPAMTGIFLWTGINYMGESRSWPKKGSGSGLLDFAGFENPSYHMFKSIWSEEPHLYITTQTAEKSPYRLAGNQIMEKEENWAIRQKWGWQEVNEHWNYEKGALIAVEVYTNQTAIELFLNEKSLGIQKLSDVNDHILKWMVPFQAGKLEARAVNAPNISTIIETAKQPSKMKLNMVEGEITKDPYAVAHLEVQLMDQEGLPVKHSEAYIQFEIEGPAKLLGVDNGSPTNVQAYQNHQIETHQGKALAIIQSQGKAGKVKININGEGLEPIEKHIYLN
ncbi:sugar-binding domain-containing protein [Persicobacter diffluens]|uniref:Beta-galactosidase n=1 Tax=Persicobacter diffluens TaxID=981 RepID=A0AAN5AL08_9BACT|nr:beta-galactosidase [Persicobacter diffluens]